MRTRLCAFCWFAALTCGLPDVNAGEQITVVVGRDAPELERFAAAELQDQFQRLFDAEVEIAHALPGGGEESAAVESILTTCAAIARTDRRTWDP